RGRWRSDPQLPRALAAAGRQPRGCALLAAGQRRFVPALALVLALGETRHRGDVLALVEADESHALGGAADHADLVHAQPDHLAAAGDGHDLIVVLDHADALDAACLVCRPQRDYALPSAPPHPVFIHLGALAEPVLVD